MTEKYCNNPTTANKITDHYPAIQLTIEIYANGHRKNMDTIIIATIISKFYQILNIN